MIYEDESILPTNDLMFKRIFWNKEYPNVLISFINSILKRNSPITSVELISTEMDDEFIGEHGIRLDLVGKTDNNEVLNIEMQKRNNDEMYKRSLFYWSKLYSSQLKKGQKYKELCPVITINILDFNLFKDTRCNRNFILKDEKTNEEYMRMIEIHFVELNKREYMDQNDELWAWAEFLKAPNSNCLKSRKEELEAIFDAKEIFDKAIADPVQKEQMRLLDKKQFDDLSSIAKAHDDGLIEGLEKGRTEGKEEGLAEGLEKGRTEGKKEGFAEGEHNAKIETARNFLRLGLSVEQVSKGTGLTIEEIKKLL